MARFLKYLGIALVLLVTLALVLPFLIPASTYKGQIIAAVERSTGRTLTIEGDLSLQFRPSVEFTMADVTLSNAEGATDPLMAKMKRMTIGVGWGALFSRNINITKFILEEPVISLEIMANAKSNWDFTTDTDPSRETDETRSSAAPLGAMSFGDLRIVDGRVTWRNGLAGEAYEISALNAKINLPDLQGPASLKGDLVYRGEKMDLILDIGSVAAITSGAETPVAIDLKSRLMTATLGGSLTGGKSAKIHARTKVDVASVRDLAAWIGAPVPSQTGFGPFAIEGDLDATGPLYSFTNAALRLDDIHATGSLTVNAKGQKPVISGRMTVDKIDIRPYMTQASEGENDNQKKVQTDWDKTPFDFSGLKALDINFVLKSKAFYFQDYEVGDAELSILVRNSVLTAKLDKLDLYKGTGVGSLSFDTTSPEARVAAQFTFTGIDSGPLVRAATGRNLIEGNGEFAFAIKTAGRNQDALMRGLGGQGSLTLRDGKLIGVNLNRVLQVISAFTPRQPASTEDEANTAAQTGSGKSTDFVEMGGTFTVTDGVLRTKDFALLNEALSLTGQGRIDIGKQSINMNLTPGQRQDDGGSRVKIKVKGPWNDIKYTPDFGDVVKGGLRDLLLGDEPAEDESESGAVINKLLESVFGKPDD